jgi:uncharacterized protein YcfJ
MSIKGTTIATVLAAGTAGTALAGHAGDTSYVYAPVVDVEPIVRYVTVERPRRECWEEIVYERTDPRPFGTAGQALAGGLIGGAIGRQFGSGSGRDAMTLIGSFVGSAVAHERAVRNRAVRGAGRVQAVPVERCEVVSERFTEERIDAYRVTYEYQGRRHTIRTQAPPGRQIRLQVNVVPVGL